MTVCPVPPWDHPHTLSPEGRRAIDDAIEAAIGGHLPPETVVLLRVAQLWLGTHPRWMDIDPKAESAMHALMRMKELP